MALQIRAGENGKAAALRLMADIRATELGRNILDFLEQEKIDVVIVDKITALPNAMGVFMKSKRQIQLDAYLTPETMLHVFAHEARHAGQWVADRALPAHLAEWNPVNSIIATRLKEMDADAFGVYFVHNHSRMTDSDYFRKLFDGEGQEASWQSRQGLYEAYLASWIMTGGRESNTPMRAAYQSLMDQSGIVSAYNSSAVKDWMTYSRPVFINRGVYDETLRETFRNMAARDGKGAGELLQERAARYSGVFKEYHVPDYLAGASLGAVQKNVVNNKATFLDCQTAYQLKSALWDFNRFAVYYASLPTPSARVEKKPHGFKDIVKSFRKPPGNFQLRGQLPW